MDCCCDACRGDFHQRDVSRLRPPVISLLASWRNSWPDRGSGPSVHRHEDESRLVTQILFLYNSQDDAKLGMEVAKGTTSRCDSLSGDVGREKRVKEVTVGEGTSEKTLVILLRSW
jgi:hypothetical protein